MGFAFCVSVASALLARLVTALLALAFMGAGVLAQPVTDGTIRIDAANGYGRFVLTFPTPVMATATIAGGVLIVRFDRQVALPIDILPARLGAFIAAARLDPDRMSMRLALSQAAKPDVKHAAEQVFVDLLPANWSGMPPPLPADVVAAMDRRLRVAAELPPPKRAAQRPARIRLAKVPGRFRLTIDADDGVIVATSVAGQQLNVALNGDAVFDEQAVRGELGGAFAPMRLERGRLELTLAAGATVKSAPEDGSFVIDVFDPTAEKPSPLPGAPAANPSPEPREPVPATPGRRAEAVPVEIKIADTESAVLRVTPRVPAAVFEREGLVHLVLARTRSVKLPPPAKSEQGTLKDLTGFQNDGWSLVTFRMKAPGVLTVAADGDDWIVSSPSEPTTAPQALNLHRNTDSAGRLGLTINMPEPAEPIWLDDPESANKIAVVPILGAPHAVASTQRFVEFVLPQTALGLVIEARSDDLQVKADLDQVRLGREAGLTLSALSAPARTTDTLPPVFDAGLWSSDRRGDVRDAERGLLNAAAAASKRDKTAARLRLASHYAANRLAREAGAVLATIAADDIKALKSRQFMLLAAVAHIMQDQLPDAARLLADSTLTIDPEAQLLRAWIDAREGRTGQAMEALRVHGAAIERLPEPLQGLLLPQGVETAISVGDTFVAAQLLGGLEAIDADEREPGIIPYFQGRLAELAGRNGEALSHYMVASRLGTRPVEARARLRHSLLAHSNGGMTAENARAELETVALIWRRDEVEVASRARLATIAVQEGRWRDAFLALRRAVEIQPDDPATRALQDEMARRFEGLFLGDEAKSLDKVQALAIFDEFRALIPPGPKGDAIARSLAVRLADLDLLPQAIDLLDHQVTKRLKGAERASVAAQLAVYQLAEGRAQDALSTLRASRFTNVSVDVRQMRLHLEARALGELSRIDLALELLGSDKTTEAERLRGDLLWRGKRWAEAAETYERAHGTRWQDGVALNDQERGEILRAAIANVLAGDRIGIDRLRSKYMTKMAESADGDLFRLVTIDHLSQPDAFKTVARQAVSAGSLSDLMNVYRKRFAPNRGAKPAAVN